MRSQTVIRVINAQVTDLVDTVLKTIESEGVASVEDVRARPVMARFSPEMAVKNRELKLFLRANLYSHHRVIRMADKARRMLASLFSAYMREPRLLPPRTFAAIGPGLEKERAVCDYIAGMTDRFALDEVKKLFDPYEKV